MKEILLFLWRREWLFHDIRRCLLPRMYQNAAPSELKGRGMPLVCHRRSIYSPVITLCSRLRASRLLGKQERFQGSKGEEAGSKSILHRKYIKSYGISRLSDEKCLCTTGFGARICLKASCKWTGLEYRGQVCPRPGLFVSGCLNKAFKEAQQLVGGVGGFVEKRANISCSRHAGGQVLQVPQYRVLVEQPKGDFFDVNCGVVARHTPRDKGWQRFGLA
ncbi:hypothetical protein H103_02868 [Trichophyton rubrum CBS 288.86]|uniref:Uncharacterized protein n=2 Tax=Trichophyton TaxID=5550 RepID=A0A022W7L8_TRIRU|nr:hypothetical protein H100_02862 [Trichophyton rubrum MR850]EZF54425.1 hypothetical protein H103_02868 [Trichophyton rubrum CBS 288.86]EZF75694.1 hypothetical protein H105_02874 [Trichophyton soudanense CBS 452.61]EZF86324.1 hypothetical protein H110_02867 [Trichophyton rubrum MR1448]EZG18503.1 hypothetical protein H107_02953 [Trichophyton rubrum CBS 202.88]KMQ43974.1 hypothetical protein HL42_5367 [Trichophyton rubrum]